jgi:hypothetical protein
MLAYPSRMPPFPTDAREVFRSRLHRAMTLLREAVEQSAGSPERLASSWADFEGWAQALP